MVAIIRLPFSVGLAAVMALQSSRREAGTPEGSRTPQVGFFSHTDPQGKHVKIQDADGSCHFEYRYDGGFMSLFFYLRDGALVTNAQDEISQVSVTTRTYLAEDKEFFVYSLNGVNSAQGEISEMRTKFATFDPFANLRETIGAYLMEPPGRCKGLLKEILSNPPTGFGSGVEAFRNFMVHTSERAIRDIKEWNRRKAQNYRVVT
ncbi:hypothetical protein FOZ63_030654 [Perkinsus olseni]|uniref:Uncharacterized protein n=1 Tax=Perkinsus olseni TaxID=32597 RepID=A0A7J6NXG9_PEROL|nr:hypothetical protein FOZ63_030654 [Perkinsus olseni]KAF4723195.1 hypothetical protein FOZ62_023194 [Perkinsus olseni]